ncbi:antitoxin Xre/MbcA/ParS toxin-binding domain-containing protein [Novosphingobium mathurense]|uniref:Antitoxin Xre/MbcA/ParS-like toxin-binding domain-containing protein n=1 Tax=Novosphingobium mathurense TaxID=428990 RepID=A0A1U6H603_9SPHN|nr:antitoxin Xre/MbcA/ParS toxin-binding domain-containing protein [Novosphingobium mathurense]SLJ91177.1 Protein of unknown function [Novosphingobium mathurense]
MAKAQPKARIGRVARSARDGRLAEKREVDGHSLCLAASVFVTRFMDQGGMVDPGRVADAFRMTRAQLAETAGLGVSTLSKAGHPTAPRSQMRLTEMLEIISRVRDWAGGEAQAMAWYRSQPIPALDGRTPEALVKSGKASAVRDYLDHLALSGFA